MRPPVRGSRPQQPRGAADPSATRPAFMNNSGSEPNSPDPWHEECIAVVRKQPNVYAEVSALFYRPWQFWNILVTAQEYLVADKIFWGTDFPFSRVEESVEGLRNVNRVVAGTGLPRVADETIERILHSDPFGRWWHRGDPTR